MKQIKTKEDLKRTKFVMPDHLQIKIKEKFKKLNINFNFNYESYYYIDKDYDITYSGDNDIDYFLNHEFEEISAHDILQMEEQPEENYDLDLHIKKLSNYIKIEEYTKYDLDEAIKEFAQSIKEETLKEVREMLKEPKQ